MFALFTGVSKLPVRRGLRFRRELRFRARFSFVMASAKKYTKTSVVQVCSPARTPLSVLVPQPEAPRKRSVLRPAGVRPGILLLVPRFCFFIDGDGSFVFPVGGRRFYLLLRYVYK